MQVKLQREPKAKGSTLSWHVMFPVMGNKKVGHFFTVGMVTNQTIVKHILYMIQSEVDEYTGRQNVLFSMYAWMPCLSWPSFILHRIKW